MRIESSSKLQTPAELMEAQENLRLIRELMERSTRHSTFSGLSGVAAGLLAAAGCMVQAFWISRLPAGARTAGFLWNWGVVLLAVLTADFLLTKTRARRVGKRIRSRLGRQMVLASLPGLGTAALLTAYFVRQGVPDQVYPVWMLCYGAAVCAVGMFSQRDVSRLGWAFVLIGAVAFGLILAGVGTTGGLGLAMVGLSFGGFHIIYGIAAMRHDSHSKHGFPPLLGRAHIQVHDSTTHQA